jgi:hypothetical protein
MPHVEGTKEQMKTFMKLDIRGPTHMLNMLRFNAEQTSVHKNTRGVLRRI